MKVAAAALLIIIASGIASGCFISPVMTFGGGSNKSSEQRQHDGLDQLFPAQLTATERWTGVPRVARLRVWADDEYRAQNLRWQHGFDEQLAYVNAVLTPMLGVQLQAEYHAWQHHAPAARLEDHLATLAEQDAGDDVVWVVGLTSSLTLVAEPFEQIGVARLGAPHVIVRGHADVEERKAFERAFPDIDREQRELVLEARRRHKTAALLIHELAHSLGALHETGADSVMRTAYSHHARLLDPRNRALMLSALDDRLKPAAGRDPGSTARQQLEVLEVEWGGWHASERALRIAELRGASATSPIAGMSDRPAGHARVAPVAPHGSAPVVASSVPVLAILPPAALETYRHAEQRVMQDADGAAAEIAPLLVAYPMHPGLHLLSCRLEIWRSNAKDPKAVAACDRAASLTGDVGPALEVARLRRSGGDASGARATLVAAEARIASLPAERAAAAWLTLAQHYRSDEAVTWAETAAARAGDSAAAREVTAWAAMTRIRYGIPRDGERFRLTPDDDAAALAAVRDVLAKVYKDELAAAAKAAASADKRWPGLPGVLAARCDLELRRARVIDPSGPASRPEREAIAAARQHCARAIKAGSSWATYLDGVLELRSGNQRKAIAQLRKAIELDPGLAQAWETLAKIFRRSNAISDLDQLHRDYRAHFHAELPP
jgi:hypothetical protein